MVTVPSGLAPTSFGLPADVELDVAPVGSAIAVEHVSKDFGGQAAVVDLSLDVAAGSIHGLIGPNGAGKTTLLRMLLGLVAPDRGTVTVLGRTPFAARGSLPGLAGIVEAPCFYPYLSAAKNLDLLAALDGRGRDTHDVDALLELVGLGGRARHRVRGFSTGMRQRLGLAAVLLRDPDVLVLDEPTTGLDPAGIAQLHDVIVQVARRGCTVLVSSHQMSEIEDLCDAVSVMRAGRLVHTGPLAELRAEAGAGTYLLSTADDSIGIQQVNRAGAELVGRDRDGLRVVGTQQQLDAVVLGLARGGVAVRALAPLESALSALFTRLTTAGEGDDD